MNQECSMYLPVSASRYIAHILFFLGQVWILTFIHTLQNLNYTTWYFLKGKSQDIMLYIECILCYTLKRMGQKNLPSKCLFFPFFLGATTTNICIQTERKELS